MALRKETQKMKTNKICYIYCIFLNKFSIKNFFLKRKIYEKVDLEYCEIYFKLKILDQIKRYFRLEIQFHLFSSYKESKNTHIYSLYQQIQSNFLHTKSIKTHHFSNQYSFLRRTSCQARTFWANTIFNFISGLATFISSTILLISSSVILLHLKILQHNLKNNSLHLKAQVNILQWRNFLESLP